MKKKLLFTMMFAFLATCFTTQAQDLYVGGKKVTSTGDVTGSWLKGGSVNYDASTKTLTLNNAVIKTTVTGVNSSIDGLIIEVIGTCSVTGGSIGIQIKNPATITGGGTLTATATGSSRGICMNMTSLTISDCTVDAKGK